jgi:hypothetical protein
MSVMLDREDGNVRDQVISILLLLEASECHLSTGDVLLGVLEVLELVESVAIRRGIVVTHKSILLPCDALCLVGVGVREALDLACLAPKETVEIGADLVASTFFKSMALGTTCLLISRSRRARSIAYLEQVGTLLFITYKISCVENDRR